MQASNEAPVEANSEFSIVDDVVEHTPVGNTNSTGEKEIRARFWCFTLNNYTAEDETQIAQFSQTNCSDFVYQPEVGKNGTPHIQGFWEFKHPKGFNVLKKTFPRMHIEKCRNTAAAKKYCGKNETRAGPTVSKNELPDELVDVLKPEMITSWQEEIINMMNIPPDPADRTIHWYWSEKGAKGKTTLARHLCIKHQGEVLYTNGKGDNIKYAVADHLGETKKNGKKQPKRNKLRMVIFGYPREKEDYTSYDALESIKDGLFFSGKYESGMIQFNPPHIIVFANFAPDKTKLSEDRWHIVKIEDVEKEEIIDKNNDDKNKDNIADGESADDKRIVNDAIQGMLNNL